MQKRTFLKSLSGLLVANMVSNSHSASLASEQTGETKNSKRMAFVYFSKTGNTASLAAAAQAMTGCDVFEVKTVKPYPSEYRPTTEIVKDELEKGVIRELQPLQVDLTKYEVIALGTPTWWHHVAMPLQTWIKSQEFKGKLVLTANTHGGGGLMHTREDFEKLLKDSGAKLGTHLTVYGSVKKNDRDVRNWLKENGML